MTHTLVRFGVSLGSKSVRCWKISADNNAAISAGCKTVNTFLRINSVISSSLLPICSATLPFRATNNKRYYYIIAL